jgi:hypothetical protein
VFKAASNPALAYKGRYTMVLPAVTNNPSTRPQGDGAGTVKISKAGRITAKGSTADGGTILQRVPVSKHGTWPFYQSLYGGTGSILGWIQFTNVVGVSDLEGTVYWFKPVTPGHLYYPAGFTNTVDAIGSLYKRSGRVLDLATSKCNASVTLGDGNLPVPFAQTVTVTVSNLVKTGQCGTTNLTMKIVSKDGSFSGTFTHPASNAKHEFRGVVLQIQNFGTGWFLGTNQSGYVTFEAAP